MEQNLIRLLKAEEIECRIAMINEKGLSLLLYKDARVDQRILDETFGPFGWKRSHQCIDGNLYCMVEIWDENKKQWIGKQDVGTTGYTEKEKSQASDSFKRACFNWGIGRELYSAPFVWIPAAKTSIQKKGDRYICNERFLVSEISFNVNREIISLEITDSRGQTVYSLQQSDDSLQKSYDQKTKQKKSMTAQRDNQEPIKTGKQEMEPMDGQRGKPEPDSEGGMTREGGISAQQEIVLRAELNRTGVSLDDVLKRYGIGSLSQMTPEIYNRAMGALKQTRPKSRGTRTAA